MSTLQEAVDAVKHTLFSMPPGCECRHLVGSMLGLLRRAEHCADRRSALPIAKGIDACEALLASGQFHPGAAMPLSEALTASVRACPGLPPEPLLDALWPGGAA